MIKLYRSFLDLFNDERGFTLIEMIIVVVLLSTLGMVIAPAFSKFISRESDNFAIFTGTITKAFDDSFLNDRVNFLIIHLYDSSSEETELGDEIFTRNNGITIANLKDGKFVENGRKVFKFREFGDSFRVESVILSTGEEINHGHVTVPFYPQGYSDNVIIHILVNGDDPISIRIFKHIKEPEVIRGFITFEDV